MFQSQRDIGDNNASWVADGFEVYTTDQLREALDAGYQIVLPDINAQAFVDAGLISSADVLGGVDNPIVAIEEIGEEPVQCISVNDCDHMYVTDGGIPTHNTANIVFLKSTDDSMLDTLEKMSGKTHESYRDSKMVTHDIEKPILQNAGTISYTVSTTERPVITYTDLAFLPERNSIMFIASHPCVWNRNETILPMSWRLYGKWTIHQPGHEYTLQTIPTLSSAIDFDVRGNQPNFEDMLERRIDEAHYVQRAKEEYQCANNYSDYDISRLDEDIYSDAVMGLVDDMIKQSDAALTLQDAKDNAVRQAMKASSVSEENTETIEATKDAQQRQEAWNRKIFAGKSISREDLYSLVQRAQHDLDGVLCAAIRNVGDLSKFANECSYFHARTDNGLAYRDGTPLIIPTQSLDLDSMNTVESAVVDGNARVHANGTTAEERKQAMKDTMLGYKLTDAFLAFLAGYAEEGSPYTMFAELPWAKTDMPWPFLDFDKKVAEALHRSYT